MKKGGGLDPICGLGLDPGLTPAKTATLEGLQTPPDTPADAEQNGFEVDVVVIVAHTEWTGQDPGLGDGVLSQRGAISVGD